MKILCSELWDIRNRVFLFVKHHLYTSKVLSEEYIFPSVLLLPRMEFEVGVRSFEAASAPHDP